jgi:hypothetical protein
MMKRRSFAILLLPLLLSACTQDAIFHIISLEVKPLEPRIKGVPTKFVVYKDVMYVASTSLHNYKNGAWDKEERIRPPDRVFDLAATTNYLYALVDYDSPALWRWKAGMTEWEQLGGNTGKLQMIYGETDAEGKPISGGKVFAGARTGVTEDGIDYELFYVDEAESDLTKGLKPLNIGGKVGRLTGAAFDGSDHFLATYGRGVYFWDGVPNSLIQQLANTDTTDTNPKNRNLMGIIRINDHSPSTIVAFDRGGWIYEVSSAGFTPKNGTSSRFTLTGAAALWRDSDSATEGKLLLGIDNGSSSYGYREVKIDTGNFVYNDNGGLDLHAPGESAPSSVHDSDLFSTTLRPHPVNHLFQVPYSVDPNMVLFAAVQGTGTTTNDIDSGVWSYRSRDGKWQWNAED